MAALTAKDGILYLDGVWKTTNYRNGVIQAVGGGSGTTGVGIATGAQICIGFSEAVGVNNNKSHSLDIAKVFYYNRALTYKEAFATYQDKHPTDYMAYYKLDNSLLDSSPNGFHLTDNSNGAIFKNNTRATRTIK